MAKTTAAGTATAPATRLEPDAIGVAQDTVIGMASSAPGVSVGLTLAALALAAAYAGGLVIVLTAIPMLIIANAYRRLNMWSANCGASFEWVGRSISPYLGWMTGWLMIAAYVTGAVSGVEVIGPNVLAVVSSRPPGGPWADIAIATVITLVMLAVAVAGGRHDRRARRPPAAAGLPGDRRPGHRPGHGPVHPRRRGLRTGTRRPVDHDAPAPAPTTNSDRHSGNVRNSLNPGFKLTHYLGSRCCSRGHTVRSFCDPAKRKPLPPTGRQGEVERGGSLAAVTSL